MPCTFQAMKELPFEKFKMLHEDIKTQKLIIAFEKIAMRAAHDKWIFKCCRNYYVVEEIYKGLLDMMCNIRSFTYFLLEDDDIETRPACSGHKPSVFGLDFLVTDLEVMLDVFYKGLASFEIRSHEKLNIMFELSHSINGLLRTFEQKYS